MLIMAVYADFWADLDIDSGAGFARFNGTSNSGDTNIKPFHFNFSYNFLEKIKNKFNYFLKKGSC